MYQHQSKPEQGKATLAFFDWAYKKGGKAAEELHYVPLPESVVTLIKEDWTKNITDEHNKPLWP